MTSVNGVTASLAEYPMEKLNAIKARLRQEKKPVLDFGTGDPTIPVAPFIKKALIDGLTDSSSYPSVYGLAELKTAHAGYLLRRFNVRSDGLMTMPTTGSKEAIFHINLSIVGRAGGRRTVAYPNPGYPVYRSGCLFAGGKPYPVDLNDANQHEVRPWEFPPDVAGDLAAVWINYPHNPTAATASKEYCLKLIDWCAANDVLLLSDECYVDIYHPELDRTPTALPPSILQFTKKNAVAFFSLSKRSGLTGYRSGFMAGDEEFLQAHARARSNFGVATSAIIQNAAIAAWQDDDHVAARRGIFGKRMALAGGRLADFGLIQRAPQETFYLWARVPPRFGDKDEEFCLKLAEKGVITSPSTWLSEGIRGFFRMALVEDENGIESAMQEIKSLI